MFKQYKNSILLLVVMTSVVIANSFVYAAERIVFEKGDALYREADLPIFFKDFGHCGLYWEWKDVEGGVPNNPDAEDYKKQHNVIESSGRWWAIFGFYTDPGVQQITFEEFYKKGTFWGVYTASIDAAQRRLIVETAENQKGKAKYHLFWGYKNPEGNPPTFRCDGLVEYCYEIAFGEPWEPGNNGGLIPNDTWLTLKPKDQKKSDRLKERPKAEIRKEGTGEVKEVRLEPSEEGTLKAYASDGDDGSGITMVEFWDGEPDDTPDNYPGKRLGWDDHDADIEDYYTISYGGPVAQLYAKAFDQAGNTKVAALPKVSAIAIVYSRRPDEHVTDAYCSAFVTGYGGLSIKRGYMKINLHGYEGPYTLHIDLWEACYTVYSAVADYPRNVEIYEIDPDSFDSSITWNNQPPLGRLIKSYALPKYSSRWEGWFEIEIDHAEALCFKISSEASPPAEFWNRCYNFQFWGSLYGSHKPYITIKD